MRSKIKRKKLYWMVPKIYTDVLCIINRHDVK